MDAYVTKLGQGLSSRDARHRFPSPVGVAEVRGFLVHHWA